MFVRAFAGVAAVLTLVIAAPHIPAAEAGGPDSAASPVPSSQPGAGDAKQASHFASLRADKVNLRAGPSEDFPVRWVFTRKGLPVEVLTSFDIWRKIRDSDGVEGWVQQGMLTGRRSVLIIGSVRDLRRDPRPDGLIVARVEPGVVAGVSKCQPVWCEITARDYRGWVRRDEVWGLQPDEVIE